MAQLLGREVNYPGLSPQGRAPTPHLSDNWELTAPMSSLSAWWALPWRWSRPFRWCCYSGALGLSWGQIEAPRGSHPRHSSALHPPQFRVADPTAPPPPPFSCLPPPCCPPPLPCSILPAPCSCPAQHVLLLPTVTPSAALRVSRVPRTVPQPLSRVSEPPSGHVPLPSSSTASEDESRPES